MPQSTVKSFHSLSIEHPDFATHPRFWTSHHLSVVKCSFQQVESENAHEPVILDTKQAEDMAEWALALARDKFTEWKGHDVDTLLCDNEPTPIEYTDYWLTFHYGQRIVRLYNSHVHIYCIKEEISMPHANPIIGYYTYTTDKERRDKLVANRAPNGRINKPAQNICDIKYRKVTPTNWRHDPYLVCLLMSLAQLQKRHALAAPKGPFLARLLVTNLADVTYAYVYKADIPLQLLESLDSPTRTIEDFVFPTVNYVVVPFEPYSTFAERIRAELAGPEYSSPPELVNSNQSVPSEPHGEKRKRDEE
ncbi:hypothetical protein LB503_003372 [Fusarium chuoi]|nr:hypothetical protein LB503_003372 [Fusarium chuoi]